MDLPLLEELEKEERLFKRFKFSGTDDVQVAGNLRSGFIVNVRRVGEEGTAEPEPGACCLDDGTCEVVTLGQCLLDGGVFQGGGTVCEDFDCTQGACCVDGECSVTTEADCEGDWQGEGTDCDTTGACCIGEDCSVATEACCTSAGGTYQGDDTTCDPNPCEMPPCNGCGFDAFDGSGRKFLTATFHESASCSVPISGCACTVDFTSVQTINPLDCTMSSVCSGSYDCDDGSHMDWQEPTCNTPIEYYGCCANKTSDSGFCGELCAFPGCEPIGTSATHAECSWHNEPEEHINDGTITVDLSNECIP